MVTLCVYSNDQWVKLWTKKKQNVTCQFYLVSKEVSKNQLLALDYRWLIIPQVIVGVSLYLLCKSTAEFLVSQCPYAMRGLVSGAPIITYRVSSGVCSLSLKLATRFHKSGITGFKGSNCGVWYYLAYAVMSLLMLVGVLIIGKKCYKYRRRDEDIHNRQMFAENYYEKYLPVLSNIHKYLKLQICKLQSLFCTI